MQSIWFMGGVLFLVANLYPASLVAGPLLIRFDFPVFLQAIQDGAGWVYWLFVYPYWTLLLIVGQLTPVFLLGDLIKGPLWRIFRRYRARWRRIESGCVLGLLALGSAYVVGRIYHDTCHVRITTKTLAVRNLPADLEGFTIAHISDLQADQLTGRERMTRYIDAVNAVRPDIVLFSGDLVTQGTRYIDAGARMLGRITAPYGVVACLGDHDIWADGPRVVAALEGEGVTVLDDKNLIVPVQTGHILITGLTSTYSRRSRPDRVRRLAGRHLEMDVSILLAHQPSRAVVEAGNKYGYDLFAGGHTHGGQVVLRWFGWAAAPVMFETPYLTGFYTAGDLTVSINNGLGLTLAPIRFQAPAEVTVIRLVRRRNTA